MKTPKRHFEIIWPLAPHAFEASAGSCNKIYARLFEFLILLKSALGIEFGEQLFMLFNSISININKTCLYLIFRFVSWDEVWQDNKFLFDFFQCFSTNQNERAVLAQVCQKWREVLYQPEFWREVRPVIHCRAIRSWSSPGSTCTSSSTATSSTSNQSITNR